MGPSTLIGSLMDAVLALFFFSIVLFVLSTYLLNRDKDEKLYENLTMVSAALSILFFLISMILTALWMWT